MEVLNGGEVLNSEPRKTGTAETSIDLLSVAAMSSTCSKLS